MSKIIDKLKEDWKETSWNHKILAILGGCSVLMEIMTPLAIAIFWGYYFGLSEVFSTIVLVIGGLATFFRAIKIGFMK